MRSIKISEEVWGAIAEIGKFGETPDDVLRKIFMITKSKKRISKPRNRYATNRMTANAREGQLHVAFADGSASSWSLPSPEDKVGIRTVRDKATDFAKQHGASLGQVNAVKKALTDNAYYLTK